MESNDVDGMGSQEKILLAHQCRDENNVLSMNIGITIANPIYTNI